MKLTDTDPMPFGKYRGKPMQDVPVSYLHWLYHDSEDGKREATDAVRQYVRDNITALKVENGDLIWDLSHGHTPKPEMNPPF